MANLLPEKSKKKIRRDQKIRLVIILVTLFSIVMLISSALIVPSVILSRSKEKTSRERIEILQKIRELKKEDSAAAKLITLEKQVETLGVLKRGVLIKELISVVLEEKPSSVSLSAILFENTENGTEINLKGIADRRNDLILYGKNLEATFNRVDLPISNLAQNIDVDFSIGLLYSK